MSKPALNAGQQAAADAVFAFLLSSEKEMCITGPAGVGKSFLMNHIKETVMPWYQDAVRLMGENPRYHRVSFTATTNKAAEALSQAVRDQCSTIQSYLDLKLVKSGGETRLQRKEGWQPIRGELLFVDETSMVNHELLGHMRNGTMDCKLIYVGDACQLPPVGLEQSPIYEQKLRTVELTQPMRNAGQPALVELCECLRQAVKAGVAARIQEVPGVIDWLTPQEMLAEIGARFQSTDPHARILCQSNQKVIDVCRYIRSKVRNQQGLVSVGDRLVAAGAYAPEAGAGLKVEQEVRVTWVGEERIRQIQGKYDGEPQFYQALPIMVDSPRSGMLSVDMPVNRKHVLDLIKHYHQVKDHRTAYKLEGRIVDLRPADACTVHKSQGSTYDTVYVDLTDISRSNARGQVLRMLYVAISRARNRVVLYGTLDQRYGGPILRA